jgi:hypothetical protein
MTMEEIWKDVVGYEGHYKVSNLGRVKSLDRSRVTERGKLFNFKGKFLKFNYNVRHKYPQVKLSVAGLEKTFKVHRLVAIAFIPNPENKYCVNHKNFNRLDCRVENLEWMSLEENNEHARLGGRPYGSKPGPDKPPGYRYRPLVLINKKKRPVLQYDLDMNLVKRHASLIQAARDNNCGYWCIQDVCRGKRKVYNNYIWQYEPKNLEQL